MICAVQSQAASDQTVVQNKKPSVAISRLRYCQQIWYNIRMHPLHSTVEAAAAAATARLACRPIMPAGMPEHAHVHHHHPPSVALLPAACVCHAHRITHARSQHSHGLQLGLPTTTTATGQISTTTTCGVHRPHLHAILQRTNNTNNKSAHMRRLCVTTGRLPAQAQRQPSAQTVFDTIKPAMIDSN